MKKCTKCLTTKDTLSFYKQKTNSKDGYQSHCKECDNKRTAIWKLNNPDLAKQYSTKAELNRVNDINRKLYRKEAKKLPHIKASRNASYAKRRASKINRTPKWLTEHDLTLMKVTYTIAQMLSRVNNEEWHVDHDIPLQGTLVSGLHVPANLRLLRGIENETKSNKYVIS